MFLKFIFRVESFEHIPSDFTKSDGVEEKWPRVGGTYGGGGTPQMGSSTNPHGTIGGVDSYPNNRQETKTGAGRPRKKFEIYFFNYVFISLF